VSPSHLPAHPFAPPGLAVAAAGAVRRQLRRTLVFGTLACTAAASAAERDPAPPAFAELASAGTAEARPNPDATVHGAPAALAAGAVAGDWASFLGPAHNLVSPETGLRKRFPAAGLRPIWEQRKGEGFAAPAVAGDRLVLFHRLGGEEVVDCLRATDGQRYWQFRYATGYRDRYGYNGGPRASPAIADGRVFVFGAEGRLHCLALADGRLLWRRDLHGEFGVRPNFFGVGASPLVEGGLVIVHLGKPTVAAFDGRTGRLAWSAATEWGASYASPVPAVLHGRRRVLVLAGGESKPPTGGLLALDPATGAIDFRFPWRGTRYESVNAASPVVLGNRILISECYGAGGALVEALPGGGVRPVWTNPTFGMHFMSALELDGHLYGVHGHGPQDAELVCVEAATGRERWRQQPLWTETVPSARGPREMRTGAFRAFLLRVDDSVLCLGEFGHLLRLDLSPEGVRIVERAWLFAATETWTPPVLSRGLLYVCQNTRDTIRDTPPRLLCYDLRAAE
jgi:outer membrane protein assembly factor BamB